MEVLKIHPWSSRDNHIEKLNCLIFNLNPHPKVNWKSIIKCKKIKEVLIFLRLKSFVKTSSGKGLDLYIFPFLLITIVINFMILLINWRN
ncbi:hypothetical protein [Candidatus Coxiella mudrowiae]|uniref:non-homologous end-joining DNA ligase LigD n=1 Tax=Candidatus Coxiella mudrowiae TaxID=2054173 RepID=UPI003CC81F42